MANIKEQENKYVSDMKRGGIKMTPHTELAARMGFTAGANLFRVIGQHEGDQARRNKIIDALGIVAEETMV